jgi:hypothetical protein
LSEVEFCSLLARKRRLKELNERQAREIADVFGNTLRRAFTGACR